MTGERKRGRPATARCPSASAYRRHQRNGETCNDPQGCHTAYLKQQALYYQQRKERKKP